jgi:hypothetical protein
MDEPLLPVKTGPIVAEASDEPTFITSEIVPAPVEEKRPEVTENVRMNGIVIAVIIAVIIVLLIVVWLFMPKPTGGAK